MHGGDARCGERVPAGNDAVAGAYLVLGRPGANGGEAGGSWGKLGALPAPDGNRWRDATPEDVTHIRWHVPAQLAMMGKGQLTWSGIVR